MHLACAVGTPLLSLFYSYDSFHLKKWQPKEDLYNCRVLLENITAERILDEISRLRVKD